MIVRELDRLEARFVATGETLDKERVALPSFFLAAYHPDTLRQLLFLRSALDWKKSVTHRFIAALVLGHLHGETNRSPNYLSNQMPHTISTKPGYSKRYWSDRNLKPPRRDAFELLRDRARFRLRDGSPSRRGVMALCDARDAGREFMAYQESVAAVVTSPPYLDMTNFEEDQWLRLWFLGGPPQPNYGQISRDDRLRSSVRYWNFLTEVWRGIQPLLMKSAIVVCRIGARLSPDEIEGRLTETLHSVWSHVSLADKPRVTTILNRQARILHPESSGCRQEIDFIFELGRPVRA